jgi:hypothetical protein
MSIELLTIVRERFDSNMSLFQASFLHMSLKKTWKEN